MSKSILLDSLNGDWIVHGEGTAKYWTRGNYKISHSDNIFNTNEQGWIIKELQGLQILGLATSGDPWQSDAKIIWNPKAIYTEANINDFQVIAITDNVVDISNYYLCNEIKYDKNDEMISWVGKEVFLRKDEDNKLHIIYSDDVREGLISEGLNVIVGDIYNFNATAQLFIYPEIGLDTSIIEEHAARPQHIAMDKKAYVNGKLVTGNMPLSTITIPSSQESNLIISSGYLENDYILPQVELKIDEDYPYKITVGTGYIQEQIINLGVSTPSTQEYKITLSVGFLPDQITYVNTKIQGTEAASSENILQGKIAFVNDTKITGTIGTINVENITPVIDEKNYTLTIPKGYLAQDYIYKIKTSILQLDGNTIVISNGFANNINAKLKLSGNIAFKSSLSDNIITINLQGIDVENITPVIDKSNYTLTIPSGYLSENYVHTIPIVSPELNDQGTQITIGVGYFSTEMEIPISKIKSEGKIITIPKGYILEQESFTLNNMSTIITQNAASASDILYGKIAFVNDTKITGEMLTYEGQNQINPTIENIVLSTENKYIKSDITISGDVNLISDNIKSGLSIFDVEGTFTSDATVTSQYLLKDIIAYGNGNKIIGTIETINVENIEPVIDDNTYTLTISSGYLQEEYIHEISISKPSKNTITDGTNITYNVNIPQGYIKEEINYSFTADLSQGDTDFSQVTASPNYVLQGYTFYNVNGQLTQGLIKTISPQLNDNIITISEGYINESNLTLKLSDDIQFTSSLSENIITITIGIYNDIVQVTPSSSAITLKTANKYIKSDITISGDVNLISENIKSGVSIFGIEGTLQQGYDTSDATVISDNLLQGVIAYGQEGRLQGTAKKVTLNQDANVFSIDKGFVDEQQKIELTKITPQQSDVKGKQNQILLGTGYINQESYEVAISEKTKDDNKITLSKGYLNEQITYMDQAYLLKELQQI